MPITIGITLLALLFIASVVIAIGFLKQCAVVLQNAPVLAEGLSPDPTILINHTSSPRVLRGNNDQYTEQEIQLIKLTAVRLMKRLCDAVCEDTESQRLTITTTSRYATDFATVYTQHLVAALEATGIKRDNYTATPEVTESHVLYHLSTPRHPSLGTLAVPLGKIKTLVENWH